MNKSNTNIIFLLLLFLAFDSKAQDNFPKWQISLGSGPSFLLNQNDYKYNINRMNANNTNLNNGYSISPKLTYYRNEHFGYGLGIDLFNGYGGEVVLVNDPKNYFNELKDIFFLQTYGDRNLSNYYSFVSLKPFKELNRHELNIETGIGLSRFNFSETKGSNYNPEYREIINKNKDVYIYNQKRKGFGLLGKMGLEYFYHFKTPFLSLGIAISYTTVPFNGYTEKKVLNQRIKNVSEINVLDNQRVKLFRTNPNINPVNFNLLDTHIVVKLNPLSR